VDGLDENSIVDKYCLCHTASEIIAEFGDEVPYTSYVLCVIESLFSANARINIDNIRVKFLFMKFCETSIVKKYNNYKLTSSYCHGPSAVPRRQNEYFIPWPSASMHLSPTPN